MTARSPRGNRVSLTRTGLAATLTHARAMRVICRCYVYVYVFLTRVLRMCACPCTRVLSTMLLISACELQRIRAESDMLGSPLASSGSPYSTILASSWSPYV